MPRRHAIAGAIALAIALALLAAWRFGLFGDAPPPATSHQAAVPGPVTPASYVGSAACRGCHADEYQRWQSSQHAVSMQVADERTVLGDFSGVRHRHRGVTSEFFRTSVEWQSEHMKFQFCCRCVQCSSSVWAMRSFG
jgi:hypothetical protein